MIYDLYKKGVIRKKSDITIVGGGTIGLLIADILEKKGFSIIVLESGKIYQNSNYHKLNKVLFSKKKYHSALNGRFRCLGGTSTRWGGGLIPFQDVDFKKGGWPLSIKKIKKNIRYIEKLFKLSNKSYRNNNLFKDKNFIASYAKLPKFKYRNTFNIFKKSIISKERLNVWINSTVNKFKVKGSKLKCISAMSSDGSIIEVESEKYIFCTGAIETTKLLLLLDKQNSKIISKSSNLLGRYFSDHISLPIADITNPSFRKLNLLFSYDFSNGIKKIRILMKNKSILRKKYPPFFLNVPISTDNDITYKSLRNFFQFIQKNKFPKFKDIKILISNYNWVLKLLWWRFIKKKLLVSNKLQFKLHLIIEQSPKFSNKISLSSKKDYLGSNIPIINWDLDKKDFDNINNIKYEIRSFWQKSILKNYGNLKIYSNKKISKQLKNYGGIHHPSGSTRMAKSSKNGIVNKDLQIFNIKNSYVVSTSVFPSGGEANPTMTLFQIGIELTKLFSKKK